MITQKEVIEITRRLGFPITGQTLRNYIRSGLVQGAYNVPSGIPGKGISTIYPIETAIEAIVAKDMLTKNNRKLNSKQVALARQICIVNNQINLLTKETLIDYIKKCGGKIIDDSLINSKFATLEINGIIISINLLLNLTNEWITKTSIIKAKINNL